MPKKKDCVTEMDMFGHRFDLNFNKRGEEHKTFITGFASMIIRTFIAIYVFLVFKRMINKEGDNNTTFVKPVDLNEYGNIDYLTSGMKIFHVISRTKAEELGAGSEDTTSEDDDESETPQSSRAEAQADNLATGYKDMMSLDGSLSRYVDVGYEYVTTDYTKGIG